MKLYYIYHSGFAIEADGVTVIIDYYRDSQDGGGIVHDRLLGNPGSLYVLATHFHPDHFDRQVLAWREARPDICYLFSKDILRHRRATASEAVYLKKGDTYDDGRLHVKAFGSTDVGVSFLIGLQGALLFHAGDLNNWHWRAESTPQEARKAEGDFLAEIRQLREGAPGRIDVAMFPVDSRMGDGYMRGARQFIEQLQPRIFVPMHFGQDYQGGNAIGSFAAEHGCRFLPVTRRGECFDINI